MTEHSQRLKAREQALKQEAERARQAVNAGHSTQVSMCSAEAQPNPREKRTACLDTGSGCPNHVAHLRLSNGPPEAAR